MPSPAATAQALPWGTPGQGSGRRRRQTPGSTRSPRPTSRLRSGPGTAGTYCRIAGRDASARSQARGWMPRGGTLSAMAADTESKPKRAAKSATAKVVKTYFDALNDHDVDAAVACWAVGGEEHIHGQRD